MTVPMWWWRLPRCDLAWTWASASTSSTPPPTSLSQPPSSAPATTPRSFLPPKPSARVGQHARLCLSGLQTHVITWCLLGPDTLMLLRLKATHYFTSCGLKGPPESNFVSSHCNERQTFQILYCLDKFLFFSCKHQRRNFSWCLIRVSSLFSGHPGAIDLQVRDSFSFGREFKHNITL